MMLPLINPLSPWRIGVPIGLLLVGLALWWLGEPVAAWLSVALGLASFLLGPRAQAWRYVAPGLLAVLVFVILPMGYTLVIGLTNANSRNVLTQDRAKNYLLSQMERDADQRMGYELLALPALNGKGENKGASTYVLRVHHEDLPAHAQSAALRLDGSDAVEQTLHPAQALPAADGTTLSALALSELLRLQAHLKALRFVDAQGQQWTLAGLRDLAVQRARYEAQGKTGLRDVISGEVYQPNVAVGFFETASGERLMPGFRVFVGLKNYTDLFTDPALREPFIRIFIWTIGFAAISVAMSFMLGLMLAVFLENENLRGRRVYQSLLFLPYAVPAIISILVLRGLFNESFGQVNLMLSALFGIEPAWLTDPWLAKLLIIMANVWLTYPYMMMLSMGMLRSISGEIYEAAAVMGAGPVTQFFRLTLPMVIKPVAPLLIASFAFNFNNLVLISLLTNGGPDFLDTQVPAGATDILASYTYRMAFESSGQNFGLAAAIATCIFVLITVISLLNLRLAKALKVEVR